MATTWRSLDAGTTYTTAGSPSEMSFERPQHAPIKFDKSYT